MYQYVPSTYQYILGMKCMFSGTYFRQKECSQYILQGNKMVCTCMYRVHTGTLSWIFEVHFPRFWRVHTCTHWPLLGTYLGVPDYWLCLRLSVIEHDQHWSLANARLARHIQILVRMRNAFHLILVWIRCRTLVKFLEQGLVVLKVASHWKIYKTKRR